VSPTRVVITGVGLCSPIGNDLDAVSEALREGRHGITPMPAWAAYGELGARLAGVVSGVEFSQYPRKQVRTMGRVALLSLFSTTRAIADAGLGDDEIRSGRVGLAFGSTHGSSSAMEEYCERLLKSRSFSGISGTAYLKFMSHTCAANLAEVLGIRGRVVPICSACTSASQSIGQGFEAIRAGLEDAMICGGADEMHASHAGVFDRLYATSTRYNDAPERTPRPFDRARDGLVVAEGAGTIVLESLDRARARGARIHAELVGYGTNCDGTHVTSPSSEGMAGAMRRALASASLSAADVGYVNAHGTATELGDIAESAATRAVFEREVPFSSTKGHTGHTLGACGAIETAFCLAMLRDGFLPPTRNLDEIDPRCAPLDYVRGAVREAPAASLSVVMNNNFAFGGINTSLLLRRV
jgi:3-oxoacyl-[acyl-carrier-protein] synthase II